MKECVRGFTREREGSEGEERRRVIPYHGRSDVCTASYQKQIARNKGEVKRGGRVVSYHGRSGMCLHLFTKTVSYTLVSYMNSKE